MSMKELIEYYAGDKKDVKPFGEWAFGPEYQSLHHQLNFMKAWNERHSDKLELKAFGLLTEDIPKMIQIWREEKDLKFN